MTEMDRGQYFQYIQGLPADAIFKFRANRNIGTVDKKLFLKAGTVFVCRLGLVRSFLTIYGESHLPEHDKQERPALEIVNKIS